MMRRPEGGAGARGAARIAIVLAFLFLAAGGPAASAQIGDDLVPDLPTTDPLPTASETPSPEELLGGEDIGETVGGTIEELTGGGDEGEPDPEDGGGDGAEEGGGARRQPSGGGAPETGADRGTGPSSDRAPADADGVLPVVVGGPGTSGVSFAPPISYGASAGRGALIAAGRAGRFAWPFAPALALTAVAIATLAGIARGSDRLVKADAVPRLSFRL